MPKSQKIYIFCLVALLLGILIFISTKSTEIKTQKSTDLVKDDLVKKISENKIPDVQKNESEKSLFLNSAPSLAKKIHRPTRIPSALPAIAPEDLISDEALVETPWKIWSHAESVLKADHEPTQVILNEITNRYVVQSNDENANLSEFKKSKLVVVFNSRLKKVGLLSGQIKILTNRKDLLEQKLKSLNAVILNSFDSIQTYFVASQDENFDLRSLFNTLKEQSFINSIELDVIDRSYEKH